MENTKVTINRGVFIQAVKSAEKCITKYGSCYQAQQVYIGVLNDHLTISGCEGTHNSTFTFNAAVTGDQQDQACVFLPTDDTKKLVNFKGDFVTLEYSSAGESVDLTITDGKKTMTFKNRRQANLEADIDYISMAKDQPYEPYAEIKAETLFSAVKRAIPFLDVTGRNPVLSGFTFNGKYLEAIDGYHAVRFDLGIENDTAPFTTYNGLANIATIFKGINSLKLEKSNKYLRVIGNSDEAKITYTSRLHEAEAFNLERAIPKTFSGRYTFNANQLADICKEFKQYISAKQPMPMAIYASGNKAVANLRLPNFEQAEHFEISGEGTEWLEAYKCAFLLDGLSVFNGNVEIRLNGKLQPGLITDGKDIALVLPCNIAPETETAVKKAM